MPVRMSRTTRSCGKLYFLSNQKRIIDFAIMFEQKEYECIESRWESLLILCEHYNTSKRFGRFDYTWQATLILSWTARNVVIYGPIEVDIHFVSVKLRTNTQKHIRPGGCYKHIIVNITVYVYEYIVRRTDLKVCLLLVKL